MIVNLIVNECQFDKYLLFGLEERHVAGNPKTKGFRAGDRLFFVFETKIRFVPLATKIFKNRGINV